MTEEGWGIPMVEWVTVLDLMSLLMPGQEVIESEMRLRRWETNSPLKRSGSSMTYWSRRRN